MITIYTDGSTKNNGLENSYGTWGFIVVEDDKKIFEQSDSVVTTTNNRMELTAFIKTLQWLKSQSITEPVTVYSDSQYLVTGTNLWSINWKKNFYKKKNELIPNSDLWKEIDEEFSKFSNVTLEWVKGHCDNRWNIEVDHLCNSAYKEPKVHKTRKGKLLAYLLANKDKYPELLQYL